MTAETETNLVAIERIKKYVDSEQEKPWNLPDDGRVPDQWPNRGEIVFSDLQVRYQECLESVLKGISFRVKSGEKVGIVGRTGAGKSSLALCLFRIIEACGGKITIDDIDIANLGLHTLRNRLTIIPQVSFQENKGWLNPYIFEAYFSCSFECRTLYCLRERYE